MNKIKSLLEIMPHDMQRQVLQEIEQIKVEAISNYIERLKVDRHVIARAKEGFRVCTTCGGYSSTPY